MSNDERNVELLASRLHSLLDEDHADAAADERVATAATAAALDAPRALDPPDEPADLD